MGSVRISWRLPAISRGNCIGAERRAIGGFAALGRRSSVAAQHRLSATSRRSRLTAPGNLAAPASPQVAHLPRIVTYRPGAGSIKSMLRIAHSRGRGHQFAGIELQPLDSVRRPTARNRPRRRQPMIGIVAQRAVGPVAALVLRCRVDRARNVATGTQHELHEGIDTTEGTAGSATLGA